MADRLSLRGWRSRPEAGKPERVGSTPPVRRVLAALLLPASLLPVVLLAPSLARAPATLVLRLERMVAPARPPAHRAPPEPWRYLIGATRLEVDVFAPTAGAFTPEVGVSPLAEHAGTVTYVHPSRRGVRSSRRGVRSR